ncbi:MAG: inositol-3-phosphate synthase, partial [Candidatus Bathyarchaeia archaeon]
VGIAGVGNAASLLVQSIYYYRGVEHFDRIPGILFPVLGGYSIGDIRFVSAFDVSRRKVGLDLSEAIFEKPNVTPRFVDVPRLSVEVRRGPILDGVAEHMRNVFDVEFNGYDPSLDDVVGILEDTGTEVLVNLLPVGSRDASLFYAEACVKAGVAFLNAIPVFIASDPVWGDKFRRAGIPLLGDDVKGQIGATILHRSIIHLLHMRGVEVEETYQLNIGGNTDFLNMLVEDRLHDKHVSKTRAVTSVLPYGDRLEYEGKVRIGPSDYIPFLGNTKVCYIYVKGRSYADFPVEIEVKLKVDDKSMIAGILIDSIRVAKLAIDRRFGGVIKSASAYFFKHPPVQIGSDEEAYRLLLRFIENGEDLA